MIGPVTSSSLDPVLKGVSRSIFLTLKVAPSPVRRQLGVGYLFCRAADTIADTRIVSPASRLETLRAFRAQFEADSPRFPEVDRISAILGPKQAIPEEHELLARLGECFGELMRMDARDQALLKKLVTTLTLGMEMDLQRFPPEEAVRSQPWKATRTSTFTLTTWPAAWASFGPSFKWRTCEPLPTGTFPSSVRKESDSEKGSK